MAPCSPFYGDRAPDGGVGDARAAARVASAHAPRRDGARRSCCRPGLCGCRPVEYPGAAGLADGARVGSRMRPPGEIRTCFASQRRARASRTARRRTSAWARGSRLCGSSSTPAVRVGLGVDGSASNERPICSLDVKQALLVAARSRGRGGNDRARRVPARDSRWRGGARSRTTSARSNRGNTPTSPSGGRTGWSSAGPTIWSPLSSSGPWRVDRLVVGGEDVVRDGPLVRADESEIARAHRRQAERLPDDLALHSRAGHRARRPAPASASSCTCGRAHRRRGDRRRRKHRAIVAEVSSLASTCSSSIRRRPSSAGSSSRSSSARATRTFRSSSPRTRA